jgi:hypothetical protein
VGPGTGINADFTDKEVSVPPGHEEQGRQQAMMVYQQSF